MGIDSRISSDDNGTLNQSALTNVSSDADSKVLNATYGLSNESTLARNFSSYTDSRISNDTNGTLNQRTRVPNVSSDADNATYGFSNESTLARNFTNYTDYSHNRTNA